MQQPPALPAIVITRPQAQAQRLAQQIIARGREAIIFPLLEIYPLRGEVELAELCTIMAQLDHYAMVVFVSPNAIHATFQHIVQWPKHVDIGIVGEGSRAALAEHGVTNENAKIFSPPDLTKTDSEGLLQVLDLNSLRGERVLIVRGDGGRELLSDQLRAAGVNLSTITAYRRQAPVMTVALKKQLRELLDADNVWVLTSSEALRNLLDMVQQLENSIESAINSDINVAKIQRKKIVVSHTRIAETAHQCGFTDITLTGSGDERLLDALQL
ncbi:uroporphyrinogen-III synthase [Glaciimonas soli]|uniref:uroporphyrinogen-III synthase n=1 Tax=Glaciimonas soli TaxID=2590999 RepID=UPI001D175659|nr:uroporphyrinogen-III synthase [Glaciimonas soli]